MGHVCNCIDVALSPKVFMYVYGKAEDADNSKLLCTDTMSQVNNNYNQI